MKRVSTFNFYLDMWTYIQKHKLTNKVKWKKISIKEYILEWDDGLPEPIIKRRVKV